MAHSRNDLRNPFLPLAALAFSVLVAGCSQDEETANADPEAPVEQASQVASTPPNGDSGQPASPAAAVVPTVESTTAPVIADIAQEAAPEVVAATPSQYEVRGVVTQWQPMILFVQPGDTIVFRQMAGHDSETIAGLFPEGATPWKSQLGQEGFSIKLEVPGAYIYKCNPHSSTGMIGAIVVGERPPANLAELEASPLNKGMTGRAIRKLKEALQ